MVRFSVGTLSVELHDLGLAVVVVEPCLLIRRRHGPAVLVMKPGHSMQHEIGPAVVGPGP